MTDALVPHDDNDAENPKFAHPYILLLDTNEAVFEELTSEGYNAQQGSLGTPYTVEHNGGYSPLVKQAELPHGYREYDLLIVDTEYSEIIDSPQTITPPLGVETWWARNNQGFVNPRSIVGLTLKKDFDRILAAGGLCVIFTSHKTTNEFAFGQKAFRGLSLDKEIELNNYNFISSTELLSFNNREGSRTSIPSSLDKSTPLLKLLSRHVEDAHYSCTISWPSYEDSRWICLLENKYGECVGGAVPPHSEGVGWTFIFPDSKTKPASCPRLSKRSYPISHPKSSRNHLPVVGYTETNMSYRKSRHSGIGWFRQSRGMSRRSIS